MADLLLARGPWPDSSRQTRPATHVNPLPPRKASKRDKYGPGVAANIARRAARAPGPQVVRPRPPQPDQLFRQVTRRAEEALLEQLRTPEAEPEGPSPQPPAAAPSLDHPATDTQPQPEPQSQPQSPAAAQVQFQHQPPSPRPPRRSLFPGVPPGPRPATTGRIVARLAACRHWRRPLASRLLPRFLPLFGEHETAYFFRVVPRLQPPASRPSELAAFRAMVVSVAAQGAARMGASRGTASAAATGGWGPRALACVAEGLGRMGIGHAPTLAAWDRASAPRLADMRPDQLAAALEGRAAAGAAGAREAAATAGGGGPAAAAPEAGEEGALARWLPGAEWRSAAVGAVRQVLPRLSVAETGRVLCALAALRLPPPLDLLHAACRHVQSAVAAAAEEAEAANRRGRADDGSGIAGLGPASAASPTATSHLHRYARALAQAQAEGRPLYRAREPPVRQVQRNRFWWRQRPPPPEPLRAGDVCRFLRALAEHRCAPPRWFLEWLVGGTREVLTWQLAALAPPPPPAPAGPGRGPAAHRAGRTQRRRGSQAAESEGQAEGRGVSGDEGVETLLLVAADLAPAEAAAVPEVPAAALTARAFFRAEDLAALAEAVAALTPLLLQPEPAANASVDPATGDQPAGTGGRTEPVSPPLASLPACLPRAWLDAVAEAGLADLRARLAPAAAAATAAAAAAAAPKALLTATDVTKAETAAVLVLAQAAAASAAAAAAAVPAAAGLVSGLASLQPTYVPPERWCAAASHLGLDLVPYMPPDALLTWVQSVAAWDRRRTLPPAWAAAAAVASRSRLSDFSGPQLAALPAALAAAGARMPPGWAAALLRHLASRLPPPPPPPSSTLHSQTASGPQRGAGSGVGDTPASAPADDNPAEPASHGGGEQGPAEPAAAAAAAVARPEAASLAHVGAALAALPAVVPGLRAAAEGERSAVQALASAFGFVPSRRPATPQSPLVPQPEGPPPRPPSPAQSPPSTALPAGSPPAVAAFFAAVGFEVRCPEPTPPQDALGPAPTAPRQQEGRGPAGGGQAETVPGGPKGAQGAEGSAGEPEAASGGGASASSGEDAGGKEAPKPRRGRPRRARVAGSAAAAAEDAAVRGREAAPGP
ncbi:hypothetical protein HYH03_002453 [Edaphochlamys debaryana]|uniref:Uncharacterized protein n=1 Tax=Edaphochlamys debaryana TaxID=47281 RepID=A0A835YEN4_9CHLO|nr:hypothetical protein HYH03_002453 [Edaphochlamys debaryana]|eukprot:KAG2499506.1 hypothetical protein HYH03_002453 [Edaphochlamys debaryana]